MRRKEHGQSLVEFALLLPILLIILAGVFDLGRAYYGYVVITDAAAEGAAYGSSHPNDTAGIIARAVAASTGLVEVNPGYVEIIKPTVAVGSPITVRVSYDHLLVTPLINGALGGTLTLRAEATEVIITLD
jgi:hypothetical protein